MIYFVILDYDKKKLKKKKKKPKTLISHHCNVYHINDTSQ